MKPAILGEVDALLASNPASDIRAWGDETTMREVRDYAESLGEDDGTFIAMPTMREWRYKGVSIVVTTTPGPGGTRLVGASAR